MVRTTSMRTKGTEMRTLRGGRAGAGDPRKLFYLLSAAGILLYLAVSCLEGQKAYVWMVQENAPNIRFIDYFTHLAAAEKQGNLYPSVDIWDGAGTFPPLAYCMYLLLYRLTAVCGAAAPLDGLEAEAVPGALHVFVYYSIFSALVFYLAVSLTGQRNRKKDLLIFVLLMMSCVFFGSGYLTGNSTMLVLGLLAAGLRLKDSETPWKRETGLVLLAVCNAMKLYPAVFGLLFLQEKRYKELLRLILYSLLLVILPFGFYGGISGFQAWIRRLTETMEFAEVGRIQSLKGLIFNGIRLVTGQESQTVSTAGTWLICLLWALMAWKSRSPLRKEFFLICIMVLFPSTVYRYTLSYFTIPLIAFLKGTRREGAAPWHEWTAMALYGCIFTMPVWWAAGARWLQRLGEFSVHMTAVELYLYLLLYALILVVMIAEFASWSSEKKEVRAG